jgi:hypothetical protein
VGAVKLAIGWIVLVLLVIILLNSHMVVIIGGEQIGIVERKLAEKNSALRYSSRIIMRLKQLKMRRRKLQWIR